MTHLLRYVEPLNTIFFEHNARRGYVSLVGDELIVRSRIINTDGGIVLLASDFAAIKALGLELFYVVGEGGHLVLKFREIKQLRVQVS